MSDMGRFGLLALLVFAIITPARGQASLRTALDFDGDGTADYQVWSGNGDSAWTIRTKNNLFFAHPFGQCCDNFEFAAPGDFDGDGKGDIARWSANDGTWSWIESSTGALRTQVFGDPNADTPVARDYDGDGKTDLALYREDFDTTGEPLTWIILRSSDGVQTSTDWGVDTDRVAPGDYDGDGLFDLAYSRVESGNTVFHVLNSGGGTQDLTLTGTDINDLNNPGDYDGDGKTDAALTRVLPGGGLTWIIRRSSDGAEVNFDLGVATTDFTVQNDYNGDGRTDVATFRFTESRFYILDTVNSSTNIVPWGPGGPANFPVAAYDTH